jgi:hypothetical protein
VRAGAFTAAVAGWIFDLEYRQGVKVICLSHKILVCFTQIPTPALCYCRDRCSISHARSTRSGRKPIHHSCVIRAAEEILPTATRAEGDVR